MDIFLLASYVKQMQKQLRDDSYPILTAYRPLPEVEVESLTTLKSYGNTSSVYEKLFYLDS